MELASGVAVSTVVSVADFVSQGSMAGAGGGAAAPAPGGAPLSRAIGPSVTAALSAALPRPAAAGDGSGAAASACPLGGTIDGVCSSSGNSTTVSATLSNCAMYEPGTTNVLTASGALVETLALANACGTTPSPSTTAFSARFTSFSGTLADATGTVIDRFTANFTVTSTPNGQGCAGPNGTQTFDGSVHDEADAGAINLTLTAHTLSLQLASSGTPCTQDVTATGGLDVNDQGAGRTFSVGFSGTRVTVVDQGNNAFQATLDGPLSTDCLGEVQFQTLAPLQFPSASECPSDGMLGLTRADGTNGRISFSTGGLAFDFNADGTIDKTVASCTAAMQCR